MRFQLISTLIFSLMIVTGTLGKRFLKKRSLTPNYDRNKEREKEFKEKEEEERIINDEMGVF